MVISSRTLSVTNRRSDQKYLIWSKILFICSHYWEWLSTLSFRHDGYGCSNDVMWLWFPFSVFAMDWIMPFQNSHIKALTPAMTGFAVQEGIKVKWAHKAWVLIAKIGVLLRRGREVSHSLYMHTCQGRAIWDHNGEAAVYKPGRGLPDQNLTMLAPWFRLPASRSRHELISAAYAIQAMVFFFFNGSLR